jgi:hypothetical protein
MKSYFQNYDLLTSAWVAGNCASYSKTHGNRMFTEGNRIYSYGGHFKIAEKWTAPDTGREWFLLTERTYSPTTRTHIGAVTSAIPSCQRVYLPQVDNLSRDQSPEEYRRMNPKFSLDLVGPNAVEANLGILNLFNETKKLDEYAASFLRKHKPYDMEYVRGRFDQARASVARFGMELPPRFDALLDQCYAHYYRRAKRNAEAEAYSERYNDAAVHSCQQAA